VLGPKGYQAFKDGLVRLSDFPRRGVGPYGSGWAPTSVQNAIETPAELPAASPETFPSIEPAEMLQLYGDSDVWRERQTPEEFRALGSYAGSGYSKINSQLREATVD